MTKRKSKSTKCTPNKLQFVLLSQQFRSFQFIALFGLFLSLSSFLNNNHQIISIHRVTGFLPPCRLFPPFHNHQQSTTNSHHSTKLLLPTPPTTTYHHLLLIVLICSDKLNQHTQEDVSNHHSSPTLQSSSIHSHPSYNRARLPINSS